MGLFCRVRTHYSRRTDMSPYFAWVNKDTFLCISFIIWESISSRCRSMKCVGIIILTSLWRVVGVLKTFFFSSLANLTRNKIWVPLSAFSAASATPTLNKDPYGTLRMQGYHYVFKQKIVDFVMAWYLSESDHVAVKNWQKGALGRMVSTHSWRCHISHWKTRR